MPSFSMISEGFIASSMGETKVREREAAHGCKAYLANPVC